MKDSGIQYMTINAVKSPAYNYFPGTTLSQSSEMIATMYLVNTKCMRKMTGMMFYKIKHT